MSQDPDASSTTPPSPSTPPLSSIPPPTPGTPPVSPQKPTDVVAAYWATGTITRGGAGPCYGMVTDAGVELALYTTAEVELVEGEQVRVRVRPASFRIDCGSGRVTSLLDVDRG